MSKQLEEYIDQQLANGHGRCLILINDILGNKFYGTDEIDIYQTNVVISILLKFQGRGWDNKSSDCYLVLVQENDVVIYDVYSTKKNIVPLDRFRQLGELPFYRNIANESPIIKEIFGQCNNPLLYQFFNTKLNYDKFIQKANEYIQDNPDQAAFLGQDKYKTTKRAI